MVSGHQMIVVYSGSYMFLFYILVPLELTHGDIHHINEQLYISDLSEATNYLVL